MNKNFAHLLGLIAVAAFLAAADLRADTFAYSYDFRDGGTVSGDFTGTLSGSDVDNIDWSSLTMVIDGSQIDSPFSTTFSSTTISFDASQNNFFFIADNPFYAGTGFLFFPSGVEDLWMENFQILGQHSDPFSEASGGWSLVDLSVSAVPDGGLTIAMVGLCVAGVFALRRFSAA
jgi:hypothetical protein